MMDEGAMNALIETAKEAAGADNIKPLEIEGRQWTAQKLNLVERPNEPELKALEVSTLQAFVDFVLRDGIDNAHKKPASSFVMVAGPLTVVLKSEVFGKNKQREDLIVAKCAHPPFSFGTWLPQEAFIIALATKFLQTAALLELMSVVSVVSDEHISTSKDDGLTQEAIVRAGLVAEKRATLTTRPRLQPFRTFPEIETPVESTFLLRGRKGQNGPEFTLLECDGGEWRPKTTALVVAWLRDRLKDYLVIG